MLGFSEFMKLPLSQAERRQLNNQARLRRVTDRVHKDKNGTTLCNIYTLMEKHTRYPGDKLRELRAERGIGNVRKIIKEA